MINDLNHTMGADLVLGPAGDLGVASGPLRGRQRILRRLLTNQLDYVWHTDYGGGIAAMIGMPADSLVIGGIVRGQISKEAAVSQATAPIIDVEVETNGVVSVDIQYIDNDTGETQVLSLPNT